MGLGGSAVSLAQARDLADHWRAVAASGRDPIHEREAEERAARRADVSLAALTADAFEARKAELKGDGKAGRWLSPLELHVLPRLGHIPVTDLDQRDIRDALAAIWHEKAETARKALSRLGLVLKHAAVPGLAVDLQATAKARALLGKSRHAPEHIPSMPWQHVPAFHASLAEPSPTHLALRLMILTAVRSAPLRSLRLDQIEGDIGTVPAEIVKGRKGKTSEYRVPLAPEALRVIDIARPFARNGFLFPGTGRNPVMGDTTLVQLMIRRGMSERPHGFRTSLRNWLSEGTDAPHEVAEMMLGHVADSAVVRAYRRTDFLDQRRALALRWADHVTGGVGRVVSLVAAQ